MGSTRWGEECHTKLRTPRGPKSDSNRACAKGSGPHVVQKITGNAKRTCHLKQTTFIFVTYVQEYI
jgi:hypothetical protein